MKGTNCISDEIFLKEGSQDPVLTATAPYLENMNLSSVISNSASHSFLPQSVSNNENRRSSITTSATERIASSGPYEVVYTEKTTEIDGSEDVLTLHYAYEDTTSSTQLFDEVAATESLLMLSKGRDGGKPQGELISLWYSIIS